MKKNRQTKVTKKKKRPYNVITIVIDAVLLLTFAAGLSIYFRQNRKKEFKQNVDSIVSVADANADLLQTALDNISYEVERAYNYCKTQDDITDVLDYLSTINRVDEEYQLLKRENDDTKNIYSGYSTVKNGSYQQVEYSDTSLSSSIVAYSSNDDGKVFFSQSFTNRTDGMRYFAAICGIDIGSEHYYLVKLQQENRVLKYLQDSSKYDTLSIAVCYANGVYVAKDDSYKASNIFTYIDNNNNLTLDEINEIKEQVATSEDGHGYLEYKDYTEEDCVFGYSLCGLDNQFIIVAYIAKTQFVTQGLFSFLPILIITFLTILLVFNILMLLSIVVQLKQSVEREQLANASKSTFLSRMSHEIRTPLNAVIGYNSIANDELSSKKKGAVEQANALTKVMDCLNKSEVASKQLLYVINDVLDMSAIENGKVKIVKDKFDFRGMITTLTMVFYSQARSKNIGFEVLFDTITEEWFEGDQLRVNQILTNLLSNAIKFTLPGGNVILKISQPEGKDNRAHIRFEVIDTGIGMDKNYLTHIWSPFEQADESISRRFGGSGLGLTITKSLVDLMEGTISVDSELGKGSRFVVDLNFGLLQEAITNSNAYDFSKVNVLVVDDDQTTCDYIAALFNRCQAKCTTVLSGEDAIKAIKMSFEAKQPYTICLVDWQMPGMNGIETIKRIKEIAEEQIPIVVITAYDYSEIADAALKYGITKFVSKPLFQSSLFDLLVESCGKQADFVEKKKNVYNLKGARIILAEDNKMNMEIAVHLLESQGLIVDCAYNGKEAYDMFTNSPQNTYQAILMDVHMPILDGLSATREIRKSSHPEAQTIPIIAMTADAFVENIAESKAAGMNDHISKPIEYNVLFTTLKLHIKREE